MPENEFDRLAGEWTAATLSHRPAAGQDQVTARVLQSVRRVPKAKESPYV